MRRLEFFVQYTIYKSNNITHTLFIPTLITGTRHTTNMSHGFFFRTFYFFIHFSSVLHSMRISNKFPLFFFFTPIDGVGPILPWNQQRISHTISIGNIIFNFINSRFGPRSKQCVLNRCSISICRCSDILLDSLCNLIY